MPPFFLPESIGDERWPPSPLNKPFLDPIQNRTGGIHMKGMQERVFAQGILGGSGINKVILFYGGNRPYQEGSHQNT